jgi:glycosyltransferase involved in cell wall biosynthesis
VHSLSAIPKSGDAGARELAAVHSNDELHGRLAVGAFDMVYERYSLWSFAGMEFAQKAGVPGVLEVNAPLIEEHATHRGLSNREIAEEVASRAFAAAKVIVAVSREVAGYVSRFPETSGKIAVVPNGINPGRFPENVQATLSAAAGVFTIGFLGTLKPWHGLDVLADAFQRFHRRQPASRLVIVGDGPERPELEDHFAASGLAGNVVFAGAVSPADVPGWLASMDIAVAPYPNLENFYFSPLKVYEYMAAGLPVVASRLGQILDVLEHQATGWLTPPGDARALAEAFEMLHASPELRTRLGQGARKSVLANHTWSQSLRRIFELAFAQAPVPDALRDQ